MKLQQKDRVLQKIWCWISLAINSLIISFSAFFVKLNYKFLLVGCIVFITIGIIGTLKIWRDVSLSDLSNLSIIFSYICVAILSSVLAYIAYREALEIGAIAVIIAMCIEGGIAVVINYRYRIKNKLKEILKKQK